MPYFWTDSLLACQLDGLLAVRTSCVPDWWPAELLDLQSVGLPAHCHDCLL
jgi:hypothetical protein